MHKTNIAADITERTTVSRGQNSHIARGFDPATTLLLVIDLQDGFMREGALLEVPTAREIVPNVNKMIAATRASGGKVAFSRYTADLDEPKPWTAFFDRFLSAERSKAQLEVFAPGAPDHGLWAGLDVAAEDYVFDKTRFSCLTPGTSPLQAWLEAEGIETIIITGTLSNCCCESTARDAMQFDYDVIYVSDANATLTDAEHQATLCNMSALFGDVVDTDTVISAMSGDVPLARAG